jgi:hypothetical protein
MRGVARAQERLLARLYCDTASREQMRADPRGCAQRAGVDPDEVSRLDFEGLEFAAASFARKRAAHARGRARPARARFLAWFLLYRGW